MTALPMAYDLYLPDISSTRQELLPIIFVHGYMWNKSLYVDLAQNIANATCRKVFTVDLRNHGLSPRSPDISCRATILDIKLFFEERGIKKTHFICHSIASTVVHMFAVENPDLVEKIVMIDHPPYMYPACDKVRKYVALQIAAQNRYLATLDPNLTLEEARKQLLQKSELLSSSQKMFVRKLAGDLDKVNGTFQWNIDLQSFQDAMKGPDKFPKPPSTIYEGEILIIRGDSTPWVTDKRFFETLKRNPRAKLITFEGTSHLLMFEKPKEFVLAVKDFLCDRDS